ncbi:hypothetical protein BX600DRAFT_431794 [Xylariales sp. PMI_506]|nr:hypothetical protein BX600DRAFT_431794 [Xylariales sp. PMI_506]
MENGLNGTLTPVQNGFSGAVGPSPVGVNGTFSTSLVGTNVAVSPAPAGVDNAPSILHGGASDNVPHLHPSVNGVLSSSYGGVNGIATPSLAAIDRALSPSSLGINGAAGAGASDSSWIPNGDNWGFVRSHAPEPDSGPQEYMRTPILGSRHPWENTESAAPPSLPSEHGVTAAPNIASHFQPVFQSSSSISEFTTLLNRLQGIPDQDHYKSFASQVKENVKWAVTSQQQTILSHAERDTAMRYLTSPMINNSQALTELFSDEEYQPNKLRKIVEFQMRLCGALKLFTLHRMMLADDGHLMISTPEDFVDFLLFARLIVPRLQQLNDLLQANYSEPLSGDLFSNGT